MATSTLILTDEYLETGYRPAREYIDPQMRIGRVCTDTNWTQAARLEVSGTSVHVELRTLFASLDYNANA